MFEIGDAVWWSERLCYVRGVGPAGLPERLVELEEAETRDRHFVALRELESGVVERIQAYVPAREPEFPQDRVTNLGRRVQVERVDGPPDSFVFTHAGNEVAALRLDGTPRANDPAARLGWLLRFRDQTSRILAAPAGEPPISGALFFIDLALRTE